MLNSSAARIFSAAIDRSTSLRMVPSGVGGGKVLDAGVDTRGSIGAGLLMARLCLGGAASVDVAPTDHEQFSSQVAVHVRTDAPATACLGGQYAGWPVQVGDFFAMGSGPMRLLRGREAMLEELGLEERAEEAVGILESTSIPDASVVEQIARECGIAASGVKLAVAPSTSLAGSIQVVSRSVETALHKLHAIGFDVRSVVSAVGSAPLPPPAKQGDTISGIGRTNDAILYGGSVTLWIDCDDGAIDEIYDRVPSCSSDDHGRPFAETFKAYDYDFYKVDPLLFSPAVITFHSLRSGRTWTAGNFQLSVLRRSFLS